MAPDIFWILPGQLGGMSLPGIRRPLASDLAALRDAGVRLLVTVMNAPLELDGMAHDTLQQLHLPVSDFGPPTPEQLSRFVASARTVISGGDAVVAHCFAGRGRTGTVLAAYLIAQGANAVNAIALIRRVRPGAIESRAQEQALHDFALGLPGPRT